MVYQFLIYLNLVTEAIAKWIQFGIHYICMYILVLAHTFSDGKSVDDLRQIGNLLTSSKDRIVLLGSAGEDARLVFCSSADDKYHMGNLLRSVLELIHSKSGGGQQTLAQGGGQPASVENVTAALIAAQEKIGK